MSGERLFQDTAYVVARTYRRDQDHAAAIRRASRVQAASEIGTTEAVPIEVGNYLSVTNRDDAASLIESCHGAPGFHVVRVTTTLLLDEVSLYRARRDKQWGLTDCVSFVVMREQALTEALNSDHHFVQAGFRAWMLEGD